jgi:non-heme Fe2+,alpha-ketoglutarate-dependent halogenase
MTRLNQVQLESYCRDGVLFPLPALSSQELVYYRSELDALIADYGGRLSALQMRHLHHFYPWAYELAVHPAALDAAESILGGDVLLHSTTLFCKFPADGGYVSWHQDGYYWRLNEAAAVSAWIALYDSTPDNGCMRVVRGSHVDGNFLHRNSSVSEKNLLSNGMEVARKVSEEDATAIVLQSGEMSLHHINIIHGSNPNVSSTPRIGFAVRYVSARVRQDGPAPPVYVVRGQEGSNHYGAIPGPPRFPPSGQARDAHERLIAEMVERHTQSSR